MATRLLAIMAVAALIPLSACDVAQKPEMLTVRVGPAPVTLEPHRDFAAPREPPAGLPDAADTHGRAASGSVLSSDRSIRLYGPGVSRKRQTRI
jgi:hypothetical protein